MISGTASTAFRTAASLGGLLLLIQGLLAEGTALSRTDPPPRKAAAVSSRSQFRPELAGSATGREPTGPPAPPGVPNRTGAGGTAPGSTGTGEAATQPPLSPSLSRTPAPAQNDGTGLTPPSSLDYASDDTTSDSTSASLLMAGMMLLAMSLAPFTVTRRTRSAVLARRTRSEVPARRIRSSAPARRVRSPAHARQFR